jgi:Glycosyl transferase family 2
MATAVVTFVYNETVNLPIWLRYYGDIFGQRNLFIVDHGSTDGSTDAIGSANRVCLPRNELDEHKRCVFMASFAKALLEYFRTVVYTDCDEMLVPNLVKYGNLAAYIDRNTFDYTAGVGLNLHHIVGQEPALDLSLPILAQRRYARFAAAMCKPLITRTPLVWATGFHSSDKPVQIDPDLFLVHIKAMDFDCALQRQKITREMAWAEESIKAGHGAHARYDDDRYTREFFLDPKNLVTSPSHGVQPFEFSKEIEQIKAETVLRQGIYCSPQFPGKMVEIPESLRSAF